MEVPTVWALANPCCAYHRIFNVLDLPLAVALRLLRYWRNDDGSMLILLGGGLHTLLYLCGFSFFSLLLLLIHMFLDPFFELIIFRHVLICDNLLYEGLFIRYQFPEHALAILGCVVFEAACPPWELKPRVGHGPRLRVIEVSTPSHIEGVTSPTA